MDETLETRLAAANEKLKVEQRRLVEACRWYVQRQTNGTYGDLQEALMYYRSARADVWEIEREMRLRP